MEALQKLSDHLAGRFSELRKLKQDGVKIIGYTPGGYMPEELVYAAGAQPVCLLRGGEPEPVAESLAYVPRFLDTFCRSQVAYRMLGQEPLYQLPDMIVAPITDFNSKVIAECWNFYTDMPVFRYGVPSNKDKDGIAGKYYAEGLRLLKARLEEFTKTAISDDRLRREIDSLNRMRSLLKSISLLRRDGRLQLSSQDFVRLNHASYYADKDIMIEILEELFQELEQQGVGPANGSRILLTASTLAMGDGKIYDLLEGTGAEIVFEEAAEGIRPYLHNVDLNGGDPIEALAEALYVKRVPPAWVKPWTERQEHLIDLAKEFKVNGVLWYQLMYREGYDMLSHVFEKRLQKETGLPMLKLESDYDNSEKGPFKTRIETFTQIMQRG